MHFNSPEVPRNFPGHSTAYISIPIPHVKKNTSPKKVTSRNLGELKRYYITKTIRELLFGHSKFLIQNLINQLTNLLETAPMLERAPFSN